MDKVNRRGFFQTLTRARQSVDAARGVAVVEEDAAPRSGDASPAASGFSLRDFYAARTPQVLPPIAIRPSVLHYSSELTHVGCPPAHDAPDFSDDPTYNRLESCGADEREADGVADSTTKGSK